jgi:drug/metabolite transporter (DMT)-like permease
VFTALIDWFLWNRAPTLVVVFGMALVIGGGIIAIHKKSHHSEVAVAGDGAIES